MDDKQTITEEGIKKAMADVYSHGGIPEILVYPKEREKEVISFLHDLDQRLDEQYSYIKRVSK